MTILTIICSYCGADLGTKDGQGLTGVTHGICVACLELETRVVLATMQVQREIEARRERDA